MEKVEIISFDGIVKPNKAIIEIKEKLDLKKIDEFDQCGEVVCFTGNRPARLPWKNNEDCPLCIAFKERLNMLLECLIKKGAKHFIVGGALGFDTLAGEAVLALKYSKRYNITLEVAVPCADQTSKWKQVDIERYAQIKEKADKLTLVSDKPYSVECYAVRNKYMVDKADIVVAGLFVRSGGTMQTFNYAKKANKNIIVIN